MKVYEYRCRECGHVAELAEHDRAGDPCPTGGCAGILKRVFHLGAIVWDERERGH